MRVLLFGTFDDLHPGHRFLFEQALQKSTDVWVVVARDTTVVRIKGRAPVQSEQERLTAIVSHFPSVHPVLGDPTDFLKPVSDIAPDLILLGYDQQMPPGVTESDLPCAVERVEAFEPGKYKSSLRRGFRK